MRFVWKNTILYFFDRELPLSILSDSIQSDAYVKLLYKVRNTLVHKQIDLPSNTSEDLFEINKIFFKVVFQLLKGFDKELGLKDLKSE